MAEPTELDWLGHDVVALRDVMTKTPEWLNPLADLTDPDCHARFLVVANLAWQMWDYAIAVHVLLRGELHVPATIILRSMFETLASLAYLVKHQRFQKEAIIFLAFSYSNQLRYFAHQPDFVRDLESIIARMPRALVEEARARAAKPPYTWSGKTVRTLAEEAGVRGYGEAYGYLSSESHGTMIGHHVRIVREADGMGRIETGRSTTPLTIQAAANMARRALHSAFKILWQIFDAPPIKLPTTDPEQWLRDSK